MQPKIARLCLLFCFVAWLAGLSGCRPTHATHDIAVSEHKGVELVISCPTESAAELLQSHGQAWGRRQGVKISIRGYEQTKDAERSPPQNGGEIRGGTPADVWIISPADLPYWAAAGQLAPLPDSYKNADNPLAWSDLLLMFREQLAQWDGKTYGLPLVGEAPLCFYRADLLKAPAHQSALRAKFGRDLDGPINWEQYAQLAEYFRQHGMTGQPGPSLPPLPRADADLDRLFYSVAAGYARRAVRNDEERNAFQPEDVFSFHYDFNSGQPRIAEAGYVRALQLLQRLQKCRPAEAMDHPEEAFAAGRAVLCLADAPWLKTFQKTAALRDKVGFRRVPGGDRYFDYQTGEERRPPGVANYVPYLGGSGWLAVVPRSSRHPEAAFALLTDLAGPKASSQIFLGAVEKGGPTRTGQLYRHRWDSFDVEDKQVLHLRDLLEETLLHRNLKNPAFCLRTPRQAAHRAVLVRGVRAALLQGGDAKKILQNVAEEWRKLDRAQGLEENKADYRRSLGLLAK
ncbi:MAG: ABC transporter substrate-binding protein [Gemmataceae bacterium]